MMMLIQRPVRADGHMAEKITTRRDSYVFASGLKPLRQPGSAFGASCALSSHKTYEETAEVEAKSLTKFA